MNRCGWLVLTMGVIACASTPAVTPTAPRSSAKLPAINFEAAGTAAFERLSAYLQVDTRNPPGNEQAGVAFLLPLLQQAGLTTTILEHGPGRQSLIARLPATSPDGTAPLCLTHHIDVVTAEDDRWQAGLGPLSGAIITEGKEGKDRTVVGRGALDMKGTGMAHLQAMLTLQSTGLPRKRDVVFLAVADEEVASTGMLAAISDEHWSKIGCSHALNEGGLGLRDAIRPGQTVFGVSVGERGVLWLRVVAEGAPGHGSTPTAGRAPDRLLSAMQAMEALEKELKPRLHPAMRELLATAGAASGGVNGFAMQQSWLADTVVLSRLQEKPTTRAITNDTIELTGFGGAEQPNVVPSRVFAQYDVRLLPGTTSAAMLSRIKVALSELDGISVEVIETKEAGESDWHDPLFESLVAHAADGDNDAIVAPVISPGFTDSILLRRRGVRAYGLMPIVVTSAETATIHGDNERISEHNMIRAVTVLTRVITDVVVP